MDPNIEQLMAEAIHQMEMIEFDTEKLRVAIPVQVAEFMFGKYPNVKLPINFETIPKYMNVKLVEGYEKAIVVYHIDSALHDELKPIKIELNL